MNKSSKSPVVFFELPANDMKRAKGFYEKVLGWDIMPTYDNYFFAITSESNQQKIPQQNGRINGGIQKKDDTIGSLRLMIGVEDLDIAIENVLKEGGQIKITPKKIPGYYYAIIIDTEGNEVNLAQRI